MRMGRAQPGGGQHSWRLHVIAVDSGSGDALTGVDARGGFADNLKLRLLSPDRRFLALQDNAHLFDLPLEFEVRGDNANRHTEALSPGPFPQRRGPEMISMSGWTTRQRARRSHNLG